jgi:hypothetical protein
MSMKSYHRLPATLLLTTVLLVTFSSGVGGQGTDNSVLLQNAPKVDASIKALYSDTGDLQNLAKSLNGVEMQTALRFLDSSDQGRLTLEEALELAGVYYQMQCESDREVAKDVLKRKLAINSGLLEADAYEVTANLASAKLPATVEAGTRIRDDLRAGRAQLDAITASLN